MGLAVILVLGLGGATPASVRGQEDTTLIDAVVQLSILDGPDAIVPALSYNGTILLPVRQFLEMSEIRLTDFAVGDTLVAVLEPGEIRVAFQPREQRVIRGDSVIAVSPLDLRWRGDELFAANSVLDTVFGVSTVMEWATLTANIRGTAALPVVRRARRERRRARLSRSVPLPAAAPLVEPGRAWADGAVMEWSVRGSTDHPFDDYAADLGLGASLAGGSLEVRERVNRLLGTTRADTRVSWERAWIDEPRISQLRVGDVLSNGRRSRLVQGVAVTNAPFIRSSEFDVDAVMGQLPAGWEVELYDRGMLSGFHEADGVGLYRLPLQLRYGTNPYELVFYGPAGEVVRQEGTIRVPTTRLPAGRFEYAFATGRCRFEPCRALISSDARYGLTNRVTLQGGMDYFWHEDGNVWQPYAVVSAAPRPAIQITGEAVFQGHLRGSVDFEPTTDLRIEVAHTIFDRDGTRVTPQPFDRHRLEGSAFWRPRWGRQQVWFAASASFGSGPDSKQNSQRLSARWRAAWSQYEVGLRHNRHERFGTLFANTTSVDLATWADLARLTPKLGRTIGRANATLDLGRGVEVLQFGIGRQVARLLRVDLGLGWSRISGYGLQLRFNTLMPGPRVGTVSDLRTRGGASSYTTIDGSMAYDPSSGLVAFTDGRDLGRGGLSGVVFLDEDGNGVRDPGERGLEGIPVEVGGWPDESDEEGRFAAWNVSPFEPSIIEVDTMALGDPRFVAPSPMIAVHATPNSFVSVDVPIVLGAEVAGFLLLDEAILPGAPVELRNLRTGATYTVMTFGDGGFYKVGVAPGEYDVTVPDMLLEELGATVAPLSISIPPGRAADEVRWDDLVLHLTTREPGQ